MQNHDVSLTPVPPQSAVYQRSITAYFADSHAARISNRPRSIQQLYLLHAAQVPGWINRLLDVRNALARAVGLKDVGRIGALGHAPDPANWKVGDQLGLFVIVSMAPDEMALKIEDSHLDVHLSLLRQIDGDAARLSISTVVQVHNWLGKCYMWLIKPFHRRIAQVILGRLARAERREAAQ
jgi:hypothetical protein